MNDSAQDKSFGEPRPARVGWGIAVAMVVLAWIGAYAMRSGEKVVIEGWQDGLDAGIAQAQATDRPMVALFTASWCGPCQQFKHKVLADPAVQAQLAEDFVPVQIDLTDTSSSNPNRAVAEQYGVQGIPRIMALSKAGEVVGVYTDDWTPALFRQWLDRVAQDELASR